MCGVIQNYKAIQVPNLKKKITLTTMSFPAFSGLFATFIAAAAAAPDEIPTCVGKEIKKFHNLYHKVKARWTECKVSCDNRKGTVIF